MRFVPITIECLQCNTPFRVTKKVDAIRKFCGTPCYRAHEKIHGRPNPIKSLSFNCKMCDTEFFRLPGAVSQYRKQFGVDPRYCSIPCSAKGRKHDGEQGLNFSCQTCGTDIPVERRKNGTLDKRSHRRFCSPKCKGQFRREHYQKRNPDAQPTRRVGRWGYIRLWVPGKDGKPPYETLEHRYVMEQMIGRPLLPEETVHHKNGDRTFNEPANLELFSSRHGPGQRVIDKISFAVEMIRLYPEFLSDTDRSELASLLDHAAKVSRT